MIIFNDVYNENYKWVLNLIKSRTNNSNESEEMCNDIFMKVHDNLSKFDANKCKSGLVGWIRSFAFNKIIDFYRRKKTIINNIESYVDENNKEIFLIKDSVDIEKDYCTNEVIDNVRDIIQLLPNPYKLVATLFYIKDYTYNEIVQHTGISIGTIKIQLNRARNKIRNEFETTYS